MNAIAHCVEARYAPGDQPGVTALAVEGIRMLARGLPRVVDAPEALDVRSDVLLAA